MDTHDRHNQQVSTENAVPDIEKLVEANAKLIASAPDLLDSLRLIASAKDRDFGIDYAVGCAEAAIRKATGEK